MEVPIRERDFSSEWSFLASRSHGPGGQNVNKVNTRIELRLNIPESQLLTDEEKHIILKKLINKINQSGELIIVSQTHRSQLRNKEECIARFYEWMEKALFSTKPRKPTKPSQASVTKRLESKKQHAEKKRLRKKDNFE